MKKIFSFFFLLSGFAYQSGLAQSKDSDSLFLQNAYQQTVDYFYNSITDNAHLYTGSELQYRLDAALIKRHPFLDTSLMINGSVFYNGVLYPDLPLMYDIYYDVVIAFNYKQSQNITLVSDKINYFTLLTDKFVRLVKDSGDNELPSTGFYQQLYSGATPLYAKRKKVVDERNSGAGLSEKEFVQHDYYYVNINHSYYEVNSQKSFFQLFGDKGKEIRKYLRKSNISFKDQKELALKKAVQYFDALNN